MPLPAHVALIDQTGEVSTSDLNSWAAALNEQVNSSFASIWNARAIVSVVEYGHKPLHYWALRILRALDQPGALGYHSDTSSGQPDAYVEFQGSSTSITLSHELLEMLADPSGNRMHVAALPEGLDPTQVGLQTGDNVAYLVEVADPCEAISYSVLGAQLSDFILPSWYRSQLGVSYSYRNGCTAPQQVADGGYCSFSRPDGEWFQVINEGGQLSVSDLGNFGGQASSVREWVDSKAREYRASS